jgi:hypothetical protein
MSMKTGYLDILHQKSGTAIPLDEECVLAAVIFNRPLKNDLGFPG